MRNATRRRSGPTAADVMTHPVTTVSEDFPVEKLVGLIRRTRFSGYPVVGKGGKVSGIVSQSDLLRGLARVLGPETESLFREIEPDVGARLPVTARDGIKASAVLIGLLARPVKDLMTPRVETCRPDTPLAAVCDTMHRRRIHRVVVVDRAGKVAGLLSTLDVVRWVGRDLRKAGGR
ncbi:MAG: CBS domain-containing protein [Planctomycetes bacterium]|nr:CBS domain-containing protein [Planctomycetota bacterium]